MTSAEVLLHRHLPILRYHSEELYGAVAVEAMTNFYFDRGPGAERWTALKRPGEDHPIAEAKPGAGVLLTSDVLAPSYGNDDATSDDFLDLGSFSYAVDAAIARDVSTHTDVIYGTVVPRAGGDGLWLQYWFFYICNASPAHVSNMGVHEGDWEMIQVRLNSSEAPDEVTYAQHRGGRSAPWPGTASGRDEVEVVDGRPVVYVALGTHASYMRIGRFRIEGLRFLSWLVDDVADGGGVEAVNPELRILDHDDPPPWAQWPGRWGPSRSGPFTSPTGPAKAKAEKWYAPDRFHDSVGHFVDRTAEMREESGKPRRDPNVRVERSGTRVVVSYTTPYDDEGLWTAELLLTTHEGDEHACTQEAYVANGAEERPPAIRATGST